ncbi:MAG TPA: large conductance mechanosensitive channel protein MscL [Acidimicrobiia bacterium]
MRDFLSDFKAFILRGNVLDLAVAVIIGAAFNAVVQSFANDVIMGFIGAIFGQPNFNKVVIHVGKGRVSIGNFITAVVNFLIVAFAVYLAVKAFEAMQRIRRRDAPDAEPEPDLTVDQELLVEIRDLLRDRA